jgi:hypothetical protein
MRPAAAASLLLAGLACSPPPEISTAERYNRELAARAPAPPRPERPPSEAFARALRPVARAVLDVPAPPAREVSNLPTRCAAAPDGEVFLINRRSGSFYAWTAAGGVRVLPAPGQEAPAAPAGLAWSAREGLLYVLDPGLNRVLKYRRDGTLAGEVPINAGQSGFALEVLPDGTLLVGGERWESADRVTLLARYAPDGRFRSSALAMDTAVLHGNMHIHTPVLLASDGSTVYAAEPTSYRWQRVGEAARAGTRDDAQAAYGAPPAGYRAPTRLGAELPPLAEIEAWRTSWTPQVFLHAGDGLVFTGFEMHRPHAGFTLEVYDAAGTRLAGGLTSEARPACGAGRRLVFLREAGGRVELRAYDYVGAAAPAAPAATG